MRKIIIFLIILTVVPVIGAKRGERIDEPYLSSIKFLKENRVLSGYPDGTYRIDWAITEGEFITLLVRGYNITQSYEEGKKETFLYKLKRFISSIFSIFKRKERFIRLKEHWVHPYIIELSKLQHIKESDLDVDSPISIEEALFLEIRMFTFKEEIKDIDFKEAKENKEKILSCAVSHGLFPENIRFNGRLSRGDAFLLIEKFIKKRKSSRL